MKIVYTCRKTSSKGEGGCKVRIECRGVKWVVQDRGNELGGVFGLSPRGARALKLHRDPFSSVNIIISSNKENYENKNPLKMPRKKKEDKDVNSEEKVTI